MDQKTQQVDGERFERRAHAIIATMTDAGQVPEADRRQGNRQRYLTQARLRWNDQTGSPEREMTLYTRDVTGNTVGYIASGDLPSSARAIVELPAPNGQRLEAEGLVVRVQTFASGWHEGYVRFDGPLNLFSEQPIRAA